MRLFLSDTFFEKMISLPKNVQQKILAFQQKFRDNSRSSAIHLEPIHQFLNDTLRSARVDDNYRAIIGVLGDENYSLLYVDKHDEAYRWAQNKKFLWNPHTQSCQIITVTPLFEQQPATYQQMAATATSLLGRMPEEKLFKIGVPPELLREVRLVSDLNDLENLESKLSPDAYENLFNLMDGTDIDEIIADIEEGLAKENEDKYLSGNNKRNFIELTNDKDLAEIIENGMDKWQLFLHPSQRKLVDADYKGAVKVSGSAGTGKTVAALHRLVRLCSSNGANVLFTTYTNALKNNLVKLVGKMNVPQDRFTLSNIDEILNTTAKRFGVINGYTVLDYGGGDKKSLKHIRDILMDEVSEFDEKFIYGEYIDVILYNNINDMPSYLRQSRVGRSKSLSKRQRIEVWKIVDKYVAYKREHKLVDRLELFNLVSNFLNENSIRPYTNVIVDEFQDFSNPELRFLRSLVAEGGNDMFLVGDPFQRIYNGRKMNFSAAGINIRGTRSKKLKVNYRTTEEIKKVAVSIVNGQKYEDMDGGEENNNGYVSLMHGRVPEYEMVADANREVEVVLDFVKDCSENNGIPLSDICIAAYSLQSLKSIQDACHNSDIPYFTLKGGDAIGDKSGLTFCTMHSLKGLEYRIVILMSVNERTLPSQETEDYPFSKMDSTERKDYLTSIRSLLYVAITRARQCVLMTGYGKRCGLLDNMQTETTID